MNVYQAKSEFGCIGVSFLEQLSDRIRPTGKAALAENGAVQIMRVAVCLILFVASVRTA